MSSTSVGASKAPSRRSKSSDSDPAASDAGHAWQRAVRLLAARDRSVHEIRSRLLGGGTPAAVVDRTIERLQQLQYLDDQRLAANAAEHAAARGRGSEYVRSQLTARGITERFVEEALARAFADETARARQVLAQRYGATALSDRERDKAARFLLNRGFPEAVVLAILGEGCY